MNQLTTLHRPTLHTLDTATKEEAVSFKERTDVTAVPAMGVVAETMVALVLADEAARKFGGDSVDEMVRNRDAFVASLRGRGSRRARRDDGIGQDEGGGARRGAPRPSPDRQ